MLQLPGLGSLCPFSFAGLLPALLRAVGSGLLPCPSLVMPSAQKVSEILVLANPAVPRAAPHPAHASAGLSTVSRMGDLGARGSRLH